MHPGSALKRSRWIASTRLQPRHLLAAALVVIAVGVGAAASLFAVNRLPRGDATAPALQLGGPFTLTAPDGRVVTDKDFHGKWLIVYFGYTYCPDACPTALSDITAALAQLGPLADKVQPLFITVDPDRDTPQVMADYVGSFDPRFVGLRGTAEQTAAVAEEFRVTYVVRKLGNDEYAIDHSSFIYVMNPDGAFAKLLTGDLPGHQLADELRQLIR
jgi:protein SCO1/2